MVPLDRLKCVCVLKNALCLFRWQYPAVFAVVGFAHCTLNRLLPCQHFLLHSDIFVAAESVVLSAGTQESTPTVCFFYSFNIVSFNQSGFIPSSTVVLLPNWCFHCFTECLLLLRPLCFPSDCVSTAHCDGSATAVNCLFIPMWFCQMMMMMWEDSDDPIACNNMAQISQQPFCWNTLGGLSHKWGKICKNVAPSFKKEACCDRIYCIYQSVLRVSQCSALRCYVTFPLCLHLCYCYFNYKPNV